jgi:hypothetical protein
VRTVRGAAYQTLIAGGRAWSGAFASAIRERDQVDSLGAGRGGDRVIGGRDPIVLVRGGEQHAIRKRERRCPALVVAISELCGTPGDALVRASNLQRGREEEVITSATS